MPKRKNTLSRDSDSVHCKNSVLDEMRARTEGQRCENAQTERPKWAQVKAGISERAQKHKSTILIQCSDVVINNPKDAGRAL